MLGWLKHDITEPKEATPKRFGYHVYECCSRNAEDVFAMINSENAGQKGSKKRSQAEKVGRRKWIIRTLKRMEERQKRIDRRTRMLASGLRELLILEEDYVSMVACHSKIDKEILSALQEADAVGRSSAELSDILRIDHRRVSEHIDRMNKRMVLELGEQLIIKNGLKGKWKLIAKLRRDLEATHL